MEFGWNAYLLGCMFMQGLNSMQGLKRVVVFVWLNLTWRLNWVVCFVFGVGFTDSLNTCKKVFFYLSLRLKKRLGRWTVCINGYRLLKNTILNVGGGEHLFVSQEYLRQSAVQLFSECYFWLPPSSRCLGWLWYMRFGFRVDAGEALIFPSLVFL